MNEIKATFFGTTVNGAPVHEYTLDNSNGVVVKCLDYGGAVTEIVTPDRWGCSSNITLGFDNLADYETNPCWCGVLCGPTAGRISGASFQMDGIRYELAHNEPNSCLHGGDGNFSHSVWNVSEISGSDIVGLCLSTVRPDRYGGYPGAVTVDVRYTLDMDGRFTIEYDGKSERPTLLDPTYHGYFNLSGDFSRSCLEHELFIGADRFMPIDVDHLPVSLSPVDGNPFDFRVSRPIGCNIGGDNPQMSLGKGYDHPFMLNKSNKGCDARLSDPQSGRTLDIFTTEPCIVLYTGGFIGDNLNMRGGKISYPHIGVALEAQWYPDAINKPFLDARILMPGEPLRSRTEYLFGVN